MSLNESSGTFYPRSNITTYTIKEVFGELATTQCLHDEDFGPYDSCWYLIDKPDLEDTNDGYAMMFYRWLRKLGAQYQEEWWLSSTAYDFRHMQPSRKLTVGGTLDQFQLLKFQHTSRSTTTTSKSTYSM